MLRIDVARDIRDVYACCEVFAAIVSIVLIHRVPPPLWAEEHLDVLWGCSRRSSIINAEQMHTSLPLPKRDDDRSKHSETAQHKWMSE
jgi:hypothetical protein